MNNELTNQIKVVGLINGHTTTTAPTFGTSDSSASRAVNMAGFEEATFIFSMKENTSTSAVATIAINLEESSVDLTGSTNWSTITQDESTNAVRFFENETVAGAYTVTTTQGKVTRYGTVKVNPRKPFIRAVPSFSSVAGSATPSWSINCVLSEARNAEESAQTADFRSAQTNHGVVL